ncbi:MULTISPECIES: PstS family phosphate ABC transporter substrate-binding protein [Weeksella]|uniref:PstS family phosphate ABC transporter substrate-binding protein n=1 Tax=Weeksella TaxID=1013 RepID=UPI0008A2C8F3|nr:MULTISPECIES: substrate-binding domain-containing protein [Weeksella]MDK7375686.1 substrate-binding domain-containing protein [Weeksella virosa]OFM83483.1 hypothetical protein HMPREF2660_01400 [Weeksella sp. HMSC059D05]SUP53344.1 phosphate binding protein [Weeksella virosa]
MKKIHYLFLFLVSFSLLTQCKKDKYSLPEEHAKEGKSGLEKARHTYGEITFVADPTYKNLVEAWVATYTNDYPKVKIKVDYLIEDLAIKKFSEGEYPIAIVGKELSQQQQNYLYQKTTIKYVPSAVAMDATVLITNIQNPIDSISTKQMKKELYADGTQYVFDRANSSNFNTINDKLGVRVPKNKKVNSIEDFDQMLTFLEKSPKAIGIIGLNVLSDLDNKKVQEYLKRVKILAIVNDQNKAVRPDLENLRNGSYPFIRFVYILKNEIGFGIGSGFTRFAGSQQGQLIVKKEEMQPYFLYKREVRLQSNAL